MSFFEQMEKRAQEINSLVCVDLNPAPFAIETINTNEFLARGANIIAETSETALLYRLDLSGISADGPAGLSAAVDLAASVPQEIPVIVAGGLSAGLSLFSASGLVVDPFSGWAIGKHLSLDQSKGIFVLSRSSDAGMAEIQDQRLTTGKPVYEQVAAHARTFNQRNNVGIQVAADDQDHLLRVRRAAPTSWILADNILAEKIEAAVRVGLRPDGLGLVIALPFSAYSASDLGGECRKVREQINMVRQTQAVSPPPKDTAETVRLAQALFDHGCIKFGEFTIDAEIQSPVFIDLRILPSLPNLLMQVASAYHLVLESLTFDRLAAIPYTGLPIGQAVALQGNWPLIYPRKDFEQDGLQAHIEGLYHRGERAAVIDDLTATGISKFATIETLQHEGLDVEDIVVLIDRESGGSQKLVDAGFRLHAIFTLSHLCRILRQYGKITLEQEQAVLNFIQQTSSQ
jgi:uridine monophosphate synthetase